VLSVIGQAFLHLGLAFLQRQENLVQRLAQAWLKRLCVFQAGQEGRGALGWPCWQGQYEGAAAAQSLTRGPHSPAVRCGDSPNGGQPNTHAAKAPRGGTVYLVKAIKDSLQVLRIDPDTLVLHSNVEIRRVCPRSYTDQPPVGTELDGIVQHL
jgi:hypothetical protein